MTERSDAFSQAERSENPRYGTYKLPRCMAEGCPMVASIMTNAEQGVGMCGFHGFAKKTKSWPAITEILLSDSCKRLRFAIQRLRSELNGFQRKKEIDRHIAEVQTAGEIFGLSLEDLKIQSIKGWYDGRFCEMPEDPCSYLYRLDMKLTQVVIDRAFNRTNRTEVDYKQLGRDWCDRALQAIAGRGRDLMGGAP